MPRRRKGRYKQSKEVHRKEEHQEDSKVAEAVNSEEALSTIERLSRKYLHGPPGDSSPRARRNSITDTSASSNSSSNISSEATATIPDTQTPQRTRRASRRGTFKVPHPLHGGSNSSSNSSSEATAIIPDTETPRRTRRASRKGTFKVPHPLRGGSTPEVTGHNESLFGFENLESPLSLSPISYPSVSPSPAPSDVPVASEKKKLEPAKKRKLLGVYNFPIQPSKARRKPRSKKAAVQQTQEFEQWAAEMNAQFAEIDKQPLTVVVENCRTGEKRIRYD